MRSSNGFSVISSAIGFSSGGGDSSQKGGLSGSSSGLTMTSNSDALKSKRRDNADRVESADILTDENSQAASARSQVCLLSLYTFVMMLFYFVDLNLFLLSHLLYFALLLSGQSCISFASKSIARAVFQTASFVGTIVTHYRSDH